MKTLHTTEKHEDLQPVLAVCEQSSLKKIVQKAKFLLALDRFVQTLLPDAFKSYVQVMNVNDGIVILGVTSAAIAMRIKMMSEELLPQIQKNPDYTRIRAINCRVQVRSELNKQ